MVRRERSRPAQQQGRRDGDRQQVIFETFAFLGPVPVHEEPIWQVYQENRSNHFNADSESGNPRQQSNDQPEAAKELGDDDEKPNSGGHSEVLKETDGAVETVAAKPSQQLLCAVRKEYNSQNQTHHG